MEPKLLKQYVALCEQLHFGRASESVNASVSALSRNIRLIENEVGTLLFTRDNRSVALTPAGLTLEKYARDALRRWEVVKTELNQGHLHGEIRLYCSVTASYSILFDLLNRFRPDYPGIEIKLQTGDPEEAINRVLAGEEDLCIAAHPGQLHRSVQFQRITETPLVFIGSSQAYDFLNHTAQTADALTDLPMILSGGGIARRRVDAWFKSAGVAPKIYAQVAGNEAIVSMVSLGLGVGVVPKIVLENSHLASKIRIIETSPALEPYTLGLVTLSRALKNPLIQAFWETVSSAPT